MPEQKQEEIKQTDRNETRRFRYSNNENDVSFEFEIDVSIPETALAEIADFKELMTQSINDLTELSKEFAKKIDKPAKEQKPEEKKSIKKTKSNEIEETPLVTAL